MTEKFDFREILNPKEPFRIRVGKNLSFSEKKPKWVLWFFGLLIFSWIFSWYYWILLGFSFFFLSILSIWIAIKISFKHIKCIKYSRSNLGNQHGDLRWKITKKREKKHFRWVFSCFDFFRGFGFWCQPWSGSDEKNRIRNPVYIGVTVNTCISHPDLI